MVVTRAVSGEAQLGWLDLGMAKIKGFEDPFASGALDIIDMTTVREMPTVAIFFFCKWAAEGGGG